MPTKKPPAKSSKPAKVQIPDGPPSLEWTVAQLRAYADRIELDLGAAKVKAKILDLIQQAADEQAQEFETVLDGTDRSIAKAIKDEVVDAELQAGPIAALRILANKIDNEDELREIALQYNAEHKLKPPPMDNVSIPTYLKYCESLGLTVATTKAAPKGGTANGGNSDEGGKPKGKPKGKLIGLRSQFQGEGA